MAQEILFRFSAVDRNLGALLVEKREEVRRLNAELKKSSEGTSEFKKLATQIAGTKKEITDLTQRQKDLNKEFNSAKFPKGSLLDLRVEYGKLAKQIELLTETERKSDFGKGLIKNAVKLKTEINGVEQSIGRFQGSVGNYKSAFGAIGDQLTGGLATGGVVAAVGAITAVMKIGTSEAIKYEQALADLSALTGATGAELQGLENVATSLQNINANGVEIVSTGPNILNALKLVGGARPELLKDAEALGEVTKQAIVLSKASGDELAPSVDALTTVLGQFQLPASEAAKLIDQLAVGAKAGSSEIPQTTDALKQFGTVASTVNVKTEESIALIELLADRQLKGAEAGTQLRNIFTNLAAAKILPPEAQAQFAKLGISTDILSDKTLPLGERLKELSKASGDVEAQFKLFGKENLVAANIITSGLPKYLELTEAIGGEKGVGEALRQASIRADTAGQRLENLKNFTLNTLGDAFLDFGNDIGTVINWFTALEAKIDNVKNPIIDLFQSIEAGFDKIKDPISAFLGFGNENLNPGQDTRTSIDPFAPQGPRATPELTKQLAKEAAAASDKAVQDFLNLAAAGGEADKSVSALKIKVKDLKNEIAKEDIGSDRFKKLSIDLKAAQKQLKDAKISSGILPGRSGSKSPEIEAAAGSFNALKKQVSDLTTQLENAPPNQVKRILGDLVEAEARLKAANDQLDRLKKGSEVGKFDFKQSDAASSFDASAQFAQARVDELFAGNDLPQPTEIASILLDASEARREAVVENNALIVDNEQLTADELVAIQKGLIDRKAGLTADEIEQEEKAQEERKKRLKEGAFEVAEGVGQFIIASGRATLDADLKQKEEALQVEYNRKIEAANGNAQQELQIKKEFDRKKADLEKSAAKQRQNQAVKEALINTALAIIRALATGNFIAAGVAAVLGGLQVAAIKKQQFAVGGFEKSYGGYTGQTSRMPDHTGERPVDAQLHEKEWVSPRWMTEHPVYGPEIGYLEKVRRRGYAAGGFSSPPIQISRVNIPNESSSAIATFTDAQTVAIGKIIAIEVAKAAGEAVYEGSVNGNSEAARMAERTQRGNENRTV